MIAKSERRAILFALLAVALWSTVATGFKLGLRTLEPVQLLLAGAVVSTLFFWVVAGWLGRLHLPAKAVGRAALFGLLNPFAYYVVLFAAYDRLPAQVAQPLNYTWSIAMALLAWPILGQRPTRPVLLGILLSYGGVLIVLRPWGMEASSSLDWAGVALALGSTLLWAGYWLVQARSDIDPIGLLAWSFPFGLAATAVLCAVGPGWPPLSVDTLVFGAWVGLVEMGVAFLLWRYALALTANAARIGQLIYLSPLLSLGLIALVLGETIHPASVIGLGVIIAGLAVANR
ncbi:MAG: DMT family transporter [Gammaproteobacteria bacterium]|nr:DMT family transporter [Gammaproteobacteria bacterium]MDE0272315.1 DMT family transporter [Gammaproteobacteria bacterium]